ncbi:TauD/TfdA family dioxygenase [Pectobacterium odoriferum]|uniref:TauD/TfdA family dioxygenase n=2 Tax=Pectobacterium odoriferum TaxID=78398 RepID=UPI000907CC5F|nr:TauD/TfdA family dioxygenase [Pectobacterium odoriferum]POE05760.1 hypothetical protein BV916_03715 [Pectobacterium odoriferum]
MINRDYRNSLERNGYVFIPSFLPSFDINKVLHMIGGIQFTYIFESEGLSKTIETLHPKNKNGSNKNTYSGIFGMDEFPFHTDLSQLNRPPRYLFLRCINGAKNVKTNILPLEIIASKFDEGKLNKCILKQREKLLPNNPLPLKLIFDDQFIRWDSIFLRPANKHAEDFYTWMTQKNWSGIEKNCTLLNKGDSLIIDNWKVLHSRSSVSEEDKSRVIERVYLSEVLK